MEVFIRLQVSVSLMSEVSGVSGMAELGLCLPDCLHPPPSLFLPSP